jgi:type 1 glutamine amidotransferase
MKLESLSFRDRFGILSEERLSGVAEIKYTMLYMKDQNNMNKALFIVGGWDGHQPNECADIFVEFLRANECQVNVSDTLDALLDTELMEGLSLIVPVWSMGDLSEKQCKALCEAVRSGVGLAGWHGGMCDAFRNNTEYQFLTGGQWVAHPGDIFKYTVNIFPSSNSFMDGIGDFQIESEQYYMHVDPGNEVLATTTFSGECGDVPWISGTLMPVVWRRMFGKGRVFYSALGHVAKDFQVTEVSEIVKRGLQWAGCQQK